MKYYEEICPKCGHHVWKTASDEDGYINGVYCPQCDEHMIGCWSKEVDKPTVKREEPRIVITIHNATFTGKIAEDIVRAAQKG